MEADRFVYNYRSLLSTLVRPATPARNIRPYPQFTNTSTRTGRSFYNGRMTFHFGTKPFPYSLSLTKGLDPIYISLQCSPKYSVLIDIKHLVWMYRYFTPSSNQLNIRCSNRSGALLFENCNIMRVISNVPTYITRILEFGMKLRQTIIFMKTNVLFCLV